LTWLNNYSQKEQQTLSKTVQKLLILKQTIDAKLLTKNLER